jgi:AcrR family transcriptional regulator
MSTGKGAAKRSPQQTIAAIVAAAGHEFGERGLEGARMENIARRCGRTKQLIYHYYGSKERLFAEVVSLSHESAITELLAYDYDRLSPEEALAAFLRNMSDQYRRFPQWGPMMLDENLLGGVHYAERRRLSAMTQPLLAQFRRILVRGAAGGVFAADVDVDKFYAAAFSMVTACYLTGQVLSEYLAVDMRTSDGIAEWHEYAIGLLLASLRPGSLTGRQIPVVDKGRPSPASAMAIEGRME